MSDLLNKHYERDKKIRAYLNRQKEIEKQAIDHVKRWEDASKQAIDHVKRWEDASKYPEFNPSELPASNVNKCTPEELRQFIDDQNNAMLKQGKAMEAILSQLEQGNSDGPLRCNDYLSIRHNDMLFLRMEVEERNNILKEILGKLEGTQKRDARS